MRYCMFNRNLVILVAVFILISCGDNPPASYQLTVKVWWPPISQDIWVPASNITICLGDLLAGGKYGVKKTDGNGIATFTLTNKGGITVAAEGMWSSNHYDAMTLLPIPTGDFQTRLVLSGPSQQRNLCSKDTPWWERKGIDVKLPKELGG